MQAHTVLGSQSSHAGSHIPFVIAVRPAAKTVTYPQAGTRLIVGSHNPFVIAVRRQDNMISHRPTDVILRRSTQHDRRQTQPCPTSIQPRTHRPQTNSQTVKYLQSLHACGYSRTKGLKASFVELIRALIEQQCSCPARQACKDIYCICCDSQAFKFDLVCAM